MQWAGAASVLLLWQAVCFIASAGCTYTTINTKHHQVVFNYLNKPQSERELPLCAQHRACNVLHKRFWLPPVADRLCRCTNKEECPWKWTDTLDNHTVFLNNRAQFKFCAPVTKLSPCSGSEIALMVEQSVKNSTKPWLDVQLQCLCPAARYWKHDGTERGLQKLDGTRFTREDYRCVQLSRCRSQEFCGSVRTDYSSIYYRCSCPRGHLCMFPDTRVQPAHELLYRGSAYSARCVRVAAGDHDYDYDYY